MPPVPGWCTRSWLRTPGESPTEPPRAPPAALPELEPQPGHGSGTQPCRGSGTQPGSGTRHGPGTQPCPGTRPCPGTQPCPAPLPPAEPPGRRAAPAVRPALKGAAAPLYVTEKGVGTHQAVRSGLRAWTDQLTRNSASTPPGRPDTIHPARPCPNSCPGARGGPALLRHRCPSGSGSGSG